LFVIGSIWQRMGWTWQRAAPHNGARNRLIQKGAYMSPTVSRLWWGWLLLATLGVALFGLALIILPEAMQRFFGWVLFSGQHAPIELSARANEYVIFIYGVLGAVMVGWCVTLLALLLGPFRRGERAGWDTLALSITTWYVIDSGWSLWSGFWENAALNTLFLLLFAIPLAATYRAFHPA